jgi:hypothetical protein
MAVWGAYLSGAPILRPVTAPDPRASSNQEVLLALALELQRQTAERQRQVAALTASLEAALSPAYLVPAGYLIVTTSRHDAHAPFLGPGTTRRA